MKQIGHSVASLYRKTSIACPFTNGSFASWISRGTISVDDEGVLEEVVREANVFDRGRNGDDEYEGDVGELVEPMESAGCEGERVAVVSDAADCDRPEMGTMRF